MKKLFAIITILSFLVSCHEKQRDVGLPEPFVTDVLLKMTPVRNQGASPLCWAYAMLAVIETERLMQGDSVNLSPFYAARMLLEEQAQTYYLTQGWQKVSARGMASTLLHVIRRYGILAYDSYSACPDAAFGTLERRIMKHCDIAIARCEGLEHLHDNVNRLLDGSLGFKPHRQFMGGMEYTPRQFAGSVCGEGEYLGLTSFTHHPFGKPYVMECTDNHYSDAYLNVPVDTLLNVVERSVRLGHPVCWEGDISERGFSFARGTAVTEKISRGVTQALRQREYEALRTTDDHCMAVVGLAHDKKGGKYFILKNSWGTDNPFGGLMYMSYNYMKLKTVAVVVNHEAIKNIAQDHPAWQDSTLCVFQPDSES